MQEVKWAIFPAGGSTVRLPAQLPFAKAMELLLTGDLISADEAKDIGFLNYVVPADQVPDKERSRSPRKSPRTARSPVQAPSCSRRAPCLGVPEREALKIESEISGPVFQTEDAAKEGPAAFMQKRKPAHTRGVEPSNPLLRFESGGGGGLLRRTRSSHPWALPFRHPWRKRVRNKPPPPPDVCVSTSD